MKQPFLVNNKEEKPEARAAEPELKKSQPFLEDDGFFKSAGITDYGEVLMKAAGHKYVKRTGVSGSYKYWYKDAKTGKLVAGDKPSGGGEGPAMPMGTVVRIKKEWADEGEEKIDMVVLEDRGNRVLMTPRKWEHGAISPTEVVKKEQIEATGERVEKQLGVGDNVSYDGQRGKIVGMDTRNSANPSATVRFSDSSGKLYTEVVPVSKLNTETRTRGEIDRETLEPSGNETLADVAAGKVPEAKWSKVALNLLPQAIKYGIETDQAGMEGVMKVLTGKMKPAEAPSWLKRLTKRVKDSGMLVRKAQGSIGPSGWRGMNMRGGK